MRDPRIDLERILICAEKVIEYAGALTFEEFIHDGLRCDATLRNLEIMGEAGHSPPVFRIREDRTLAS